ncbi:MAG: PH domain-containing protein [Bacteroidota bacterium]
MKTKLKKDETVALLIRPHWFTLVFPVLLTAISMIPAILFQGYAYILPLGMVCYLGYKVTQRNNNIWAVTNLRVIDEEGFFSQHSKESPLEKINNVTYEQSVWGRIFGYGNVQIQTAAEVGSTVYHMVEKPKALKDMITQMQEEYKKTQIMSQARELAKAIATGNQGFQNRVVADELEKLYELKQRGIITESEFNAGKNRILGL